MKHRLVRKIIYPKGKNSIPCVTCGAGEGVEHLKCWRAWLATEILAFGRRTPPCPTCGNTGRSCYYYINEDAWYCWLTLKKWTWREWYEHESA